MTITRTLCPLDCGWHHDQDDADLRFDVAPFLNDDWPAGADPVAASLVAARVLLAEKAIRDHCETHPLLDWVKAVTTAQRRAEQAEAKLERVRALHFPARGGRSGWNPDDDDTPGAYGHISSACEECGSQDLAVRWPCPTIQALETP
jgi:hypothetical protein